MGRGILKKLFSIILLNIFLVSAALAESDTVKYNEIQDRYNNQKPNAPFYVQKNEDIIINRGEKVILQPPDNLLKVNDTTKNSTKTAQKPINQQNINVQKRSSATQEAVYIKIDEPDILNKKNSKKGFKNIFVETQNDRIISESSRKISAIYPIDTATNSYPGYRGPNQLVIYTKDFGKTTSTNEFGKEAVVIGGVVTRLTGANSYIPKDGYVISGHGSAKKWISENLKIGTKVEITDRTIRAYTTIDSYRYCAKAKINEVEEVLMSTKSDYSSRDDKFIYYYLKKAKQQYKKSQKDSSDASLDCAKEAIDNASLAFRYTLPYVKNELKGVWIRPSEKTVQEVQKTLDKIKDAGINNIFLETYYHGRTIFPSRVMKEYGFEEQNPEFKYDVLAVYIKEAHRRNIKVHAWFESFYVGNKLPSQNPKSILAIRPYWQNRTRQKADFVGYVSHPQEHNGYFLDPANPEVINFLLSLIGEISARYNIDGFNIDYVRYPNIAKENVNNQWGYTQYARNEFNQIYGVDPLDVQYRTAYWDSWGEYRRDKITQYIQKASELLKNRNTMFSAVIFPDWKMSLQTKYQDWTYWLEEGYLDAVTPLILTSDDELAKSMLEEIRKKVPNSATIYPGLFTGFIESDPEDLLKQIHIIRKLRLGGVVLFDWAHLNDSYLDVIKTSAFKAQTY